MSDRLFVRNGFTHHPQERETWRFFKGDLELPQKIVMLDGSGALSFDVLSWLSEQGVPLIRINYLGEVVTVIAGAGSAFDPERVAWQIETRADPDQRIAYCCDLISEKLVASIRTLKEAIPPSAARDRAVHKAEATIDRLRARAVRSVNDVLMAEAGAAARYFSAWRGLPLRWKSRGRHPIPDSWLEAALGGRSGTVGLRPIATPLTQSTPCSIMPMRFCTVAYRSRRSQPVTIRGAA